MTSKQMLLILVTTVMVSVVACTSYAADARPVRSQPVSLGKGDFRLLVMDGKLQLQKQSERAVLTSEVTPVVYLIKPGEESIRWEVATKNMTYGSSQ